MPSANQFTERLPSFSRPFEIVWVAGWLALGGLSAMLASRGALRWMFGWAVHPGWWILLLIPTICVIGLLRKVSYPHLLITVALLGVALLADVVVPFFVRQYLFRAVIGITCCVLVLWLTSHPRKLGFIVSVVIGMLSSYIGSVYVFNMIQNTEVMRLFAGGEIL